MRWEGRWERGGRERLLVREVEHGGLLPHLCHVCDLHSPAQPGFRCLFFGNEEEECE